MTIFRQMHIFAGLYKKRLDEQEYDIRIGIDLWDLCSVGHYYAKGRGTH